MTKPPVSVIVVSRGRPASLIRCVRAILQVWYHPFEIVVVADAAGIAAVEQAGITVPIKTALFEAANISQARNAGLGLASGKIAAFIDDDAVPEPGWLHHLAGAFSDPQVAAAGGYVRGRNGISFQATGQTIDEFTTSLPLEISDQNPVVLTGRVGRAIKTEGTNCAFRRRLFEEIGGFDPAFRYFLDESDLNIRLAMQGRKTAIVPLAQVHHSIAASDRRQASRMPRTLFEIGASLAVFLRKYAGSSDHTPHFENVRAGQRRGLLRHMVSGRCEPGAVACLLATFDQGVAAGQLRPLLTPPEIGAPDVGFRPVSKERIAPKHQIIAGFRTGQSQIMARACRAAHAGNLVSAYVFSRTSLVHRLSYQDDGYWLQTGGLFGRSVRSRWRFQATTLAKRATAEDRRIASVRHPWHMPDGAGDVPDKSRYGPF